MKKKAIAIATALAAIVSCSTAISPTADAPLGPQAPQGSRPSDAAVAAGANIAALGACMACHTAQGGKPFAGGRPIDTPFGAIFATNITPDAETGIGLWSLEAFTRAMRQGIARDGHLLYPAFPYVHFARMSDRDIGLVYAYLMSRDPVHAVAPANELVFPLNFRPLLAGWNLLFLPGPEAPADDASHSAEWNRGRYLVDGVGHCAACHSPLNALGAEQRGKALSGGVIGGWEAPALTALSQAPTPWTQAQLVQYLRTGLADRHGAAAGPMLTVTNGLADASAADVGAMAAYLLSLQTPAPVGPAVPPGVDATAGAAAGPGSVLFAGACASCHGTGAPMSALGDRPTLSQSTAVNAASPRNAVRLILDGIPWEGSRSAHYMPAFSGMLSDAQIAAIANYTRNNYGSRAPWPALDADAVAKIRKEHAKP